MAQPDYKTFKLGDFTLASGAVLPDAFLAYKTWGDPSQPAIIYPTWYSGLISDNEWLIGEDKTLSPRNYFIIVPALFGNGQSTSPSNTPASSLPVFPPVTVYDNVKAQYRLVTEGLGVTHARAVLGWSLGAGQTYQWLTQFPDFMELGVPFCGSARTALHNKVFLEGIKAALLSARGVEASGIDKPGSLRANADASFRPWTAAEAQLGLQALARVYAGWGLSQAFYRHKYYETKLGFRDLEHFMVGFWEKWACSKDPENMLVMMHTWQTGDCSDQEPYNKDLKLALSSIKAKTLVIPCKTDLYFPPEDSENEVECMSPGIGKYIAIPSIWGHWAGGPGDSVDDVKWLDGQLRVFFESA